MMKFKKIESIRLTRQTRDLGHETETTNKKIPMLKDL